MTITITTTPRGTARRASVRGVRSCGDGGDRRRPPSSSSSSSRRGRRGMSMSMDDGATPLAHGLHGSIARSARALDAAHRSATASQDALTSRVEAAAAELEKLVSTLPKPASEEHARRLKTARQKLDGLGVSAANLRERVAKLHAMASSMKRADLAVLAERDCPDLPPREEVFRAGGAGTEAQTARVLTLPESVSEALKTLKM